MMLQQHTPGPWALDESRRSIQVFASDGSENGVTVATVNGSEQDTIEDRRKILTWSVNDQDRANARLIAAAPDLLEALEYALERIKCVRCADAAQEKFYETAAGRIRATIAKARGNI